MTDRVSAVAVPQGRVYSILILTTFFWGGSFLFNKIGLREVPPAHFVFIRFALATLLMMVIASGRFGRMTLKTLWRGVIVGLALGATNLTFVFGVRDTSISRAGILNNMFVLFIPLICGVIWREKIGKITLTGILLAVIGILLLAAGGGGFNGGDLFSTICAGFIAIHVITVSKVLGDEDIYLVSLVQFLTVTVMAALLTLFLDTAPYTISSSAMFSLVYCAVFPTLLCFTLQNSYQRYTTPTRAGLIYTLDPVWCLIAGFVFLGERLKAMELMGCGLIFAAVIFPLLCQLKLERRSTSAG